MVRFFSSGHGSELKKNERTKDVQCAGQVFKAGGIDIQGWRDRYSRLAGQVFNGSFPDGAPAISPHTNR